jgi:DNA adenine methylase
MKETHDLHKPTMKLLENEILIDSFLDSRRKENREAKMITGIPYPFLKWAGGKRQLLSQMQKFIPKKFNKYIEPFVGGGALFFYLLPKKAILLDNNFELINCYKVIKKDVNELIKYLKKHIYDKEYYYKIRALDRNVEKYSILSDTEKAARTIFLNKTGYNGLYRVNQKGFFNVPFGRYKNPKICDRKNLFAVHHALQSVKIINDSFEHCLDYAEEEDFVYLDPPYYPISDTSLFTSYTKDNFGKESQIKLYNIFKKLDQKGCQILLSNSYSEFILNLYRDCRIEILKAKRAINSKSNKRGEIKEVLIMN